MACSLASPGFAPTITDEHAGLLLSCWLGFAQVGLIFSFPLGHYDEFPAFAFLHVTGFAWRDIHGSV